MLNYNDDTCQSVTDRHIGAIINICTKIHTRGVDYNMIWNIYIKVQNHNKVKSKGLGSGEWCTEILYNKKPIGAW